MTTGETKEAVAKVGFGAFMAVALGPVGILIAALAVGVESAFSRGRPGTDRTGWAEFLEEDRQRRDADRAARRAWWDSNADAAKRPKETAGGVRNTSRRAAARGLKFGSRTRSFFRGARAGWRAAKQRRAEGGSLRDIATAKPGGEPVVPVKTTPGAVVPEQRTQDGPKAPPEQKAPQDDETATVDKPKPDDEVTTPPSDGSTADHDERKQPMSTDTQAPPKGKAGSPGGETNLDATVSDLSALSGQLGSISDLADQIASLNAQMQATAAAAQDRAEATGAPTAAVQALDAANACAAEVAAAVAALSAAVTGCQDEVNSASSGLAPAEEAQDTLHSTGARGEFVSAATQ